MTPKNTELFTTLRGTTFSWRKVRFTLIELLVVIAIITILPVQNF